MRLKKKELL